MVIFHSLSFLQQQDLIQSADRAKTEQGWGMDSHSVSAGNATKIYLFLDVFGFVWKRVVSGLLTFFSKLCPLQKLNHHEKVQMRLPKVGYSLTNLGSALTWIRTVQRDLHWAPGSAECSETLSDSTLGSHHCDRPSHSRPRGSKKESRDVTWVFWVSCQLSDCCRQKGWTSKWRVFFTSKAICLAHRNHQIVCCLLATSKS